MSKILRRCLSLVLASMLLASLLISGTLNASADYKTGDGLAAYAMTAYNEGWSYVWGGASYGAVDCSGLIYSYVGGGARVTEDMLYSSPESGYVSNGVPDIPGLGLWQPGHVGVYVGGGMAVDARDEISNVCYDSVSNKAWVMWFKVDGVSYGNDTAVTNEKHSDTEESSDSGASQDKNEDKAENAALSFGSTGSEVNKLQERLKALGYFADNTTEYFGFVTKGALEDFQKAAGLSVTGVYDEATKTALWDDLALSAAADEQSDEDISEVISDEDTEAEDNFDAGSDEDTEGGDISDVVSDEDIEDGDISDVVSDEDIKDGDISDVVSDENIKDGDISDAESNDDFSDEFIYGSESEDDTIVEESFDMIPNENDAYEDEVEEGSEELNDTDVGSEDGGAFTQDSEFSVPEEESVLEDGVFAHFEEYKGNLTESSASTDEENDTVQDAEDHTNEVGGSDEPTTTDKGENEVQTSGEMSVSVDLNAKDNSSDADKNGGTAQVSSDKQTNDETNTIRSPKTGDNTLSVLVEGGLDELLTPEFGIIAALVTLAVMLFVGTIHYWNISMERRRQRARRSTTVSFYHRSGI